MRLWIEDVAAQRDGLAAFAADLASDFLGRAPVEIGDGDVRAGLTEHPRRRAADAGRASDDEGGGSCETQQIGHGSDSSSGLDLRCGLESRRSHEIRTPVARPATGGETSADGVLPDRRPPLLDRIVRAAPNPVRSPRSPPSRTPAASASDAVRSCASRPSPIRPDPPGRIPPAASGGGSPPRRPRRSRRAWPR